MRQQFRTSAGWTLVEIMIAVSLVGMLASIAIPTYLRARDRASLNLVFNNLRLIDDAKQQWALENRAVGSVEPTETDLLPYFKSASIPQSVIGEIYNINPIDEPPSATVSFPFAGYAAGALIVQP